MAKPIVIVDYDPLWPVAFQAEADAIVAASAGLPITVEHIGSTSIPGLGAKPIVDIMVGLSPGNDLGGCVEPMNWLGYEYVARYEQGEDGMPFRRFFHKRDSGAHGSFNLHAVHTKSNFWERQTAFRDHLRADPETAKAYERLKRDLAPQFSDANEYANAKTEFVEGVLRRLVVKPKVRRIQSGDTAVLRRVRLAALADGPDAFSTTLAEGNTLSESEWNESALRRSSGDRSVTFFAEDNAAPCGMVGGLRSDQDASTAFLVAMWVAPSHRGRGVGRQLVETVVDWATRGGHQQMELWVTESNLAAKSLYAKAGFEPTGQVQPLPSNPELLERLYRLDLSRPSRGAT